MGDNDFPAVMANGGREEARDKAAKWKTFFQLWAIGFAVMPSIAGSFHWIATATLWLAVVLTFQTGCAYLIDARKVAQTQLGEGY